MEVIGVQFSNLNITGKFLTILICFSCLPVVFLLVGFLVFEIQPPGSKFGQGKSKSWYLIQTMACGFWASILLAAIFGSTYLVSRVLSWAGLNQDWILPATFIGCLIGVLYGVFYWLEIRQSK